MIEVEKEIKARIMEDSWMKPIVDYLRNSKLLEEKNDARKLRLKAARYTLVGEVLFQKSVFGPLLRCVSKEESQTVLQTIHSRVFGNHFGGRSLAYKAITTGYFWPYIM